MSCAIEILSFQNFYKVLKTCSAGRKDFFDTLKPPEALPPGLEPVKKKKPFVNGAEGCVRETRKGVLHDDDPHFSELFEALKNVSMAKRFFRHAEGSPRRGGPSCTILHTISLCLIVMEYVFHKNR